MQEIYKNGLEISRNYEKRKDTDTKKLYDIIYTAVLSAQKKDDKESKDAVEFLTELFKPFIKKTSKKIYKILKGTLEYQDVLHETYVVFLTLLYKYNPERSAFSYYIGVMLPQYIKRWAEKENAYSNANIIVDIEEYTIIDPIFGSISSVEDYLNAYVLTREYQEFIKLRSHKQARSNTNREVCNRFFLGNDSCSKIAQDLGISYHAVYEVIGKIKKELEVFFKKNIFCSIVSYDNTNNDS